MSINPEDIKREQKMRTDYEYCLEQLGYVDLVEKVDTIIKRLWELGWFIDKKDFIKMLKDDTKC